MAESATIHYLTNEHGEHTAAVIPIDEWKDIEEFYRERQEVKASLRRAFAELKEIKAGTKQGRPIQDLLDEL